MNWKTTLFTLLIVFCHIIMDCRLANALQHVKSNPPQCKELNQINCYMGENEGQFCNKAKSESVNRWYFDKGSCRMFRYRGCYGNRNRFCTKEACEKRCK